MNKITLGQKIKLARLDKGMTQQDVVGDFISRNMLSKIENDVANPSIKTIEYLAQRLNKPLSYFLEDLVSTSLDTKGTAELAFERSSYMIEKSDMYDCVSYLEDILSKTKFNPGNVYFGKLIYNLGYCHVNLSKYEEGKEWIAKSIPILEEHKDYYYLGKAYFELASIYFYKADNKKAQVYLDKAFEISGKSYVKDLTKGIDLYYNLGLSLFNVHKYTESLKTVLYSIEISRKNHCFYRTDMSHMLAANCFERLNNYTSAIEHCKKAIFFFDLNKKYEFKAKSLRDLGNYYFKKKMYLEAKECYNEALSYFDSKNQYKDSNSVRIDLLRIFIEEEEYTKVLRYANDIDRSFITNIELAYLNTCLGKAYLQSNNIDKSNHHILSAKEIAQDEGDSDLLSDIYDSLANLSSKMKDYEQAYVYAIKSSNLLKQSIGSEVHQELS